MAELLYPDTWVDVTCSSCSRVFRRPAWGEATECDFCQGCPTIYGADEHSAIVSGSGIELVAQRWHGNIFLGTRAMDFARMTDDHPQEDRDSQDMHSNQVFMVSENEARIYANRILSLLPSEDDDAAG